MTAETLKPFIAPSTESYPSDHSKSSQQRERSNHALAFSILALILAMGLIGVEIWNTIRIGDLQTEVASLNDAFERLNKHLGINYLEDMKEFEKDYTNALIDDVTDKTDDDEDDDGDDVDVEEKDHLDNANYDTDNDDGDDTDDDDDYDDEDSISVYDELVQKYNSFKEADLDDEDNDNSSNTSDDGDLYSDYGKFKDSKTKNKQRKSRSLTTTENEIKLLENKEQKISSNHGGGNKINYDSLGFKASNYKRHIVADSTEIHRSPLRPRMPRKRKIFPMLKSGESLISAKSLALTASLTEKPAAHFHLNRKVPDHQAAIKVDSYPGDMYIGHPSWTNEISIDRFFKVEQGVLVVKEPGLYYVYAQVCYNNSHDQNGFVLFHGHKPFLQCLNTVPTNLPLKIHTCHTSGLIHLKANDSIHLRDFHSDRNAILRDTNNRSYFGLMKI